jgi:hypothetical protein
VAGRPQPVTVSTLRAVSYWTRAAGTVLRSACNPPPRERLRAAEHACRPASLAYIRKTPNVVSGIGAFRLAAIPSARTFLVSSGSMIPSSQSRAVE